MSTSKQKLGKYIDEYSVRNKSREDIPVYSVTNDKGFCRDYFDRDLSSDDKSGYKIVPKGFFAYNPSRINVGSIACQFVESRVIVSPLYVVFGVSTDLYQPYLLYYLKSHVALTYINAYARGAVRNNLGFKKLAELELPIPDVEAQKRIVSELDCISEIIKIKNEQIAEYDNLLRSVFLNTFGDPYVNEHKWESRPLCEVVHNKCPISYGIVQPGEDVEGGIPVVRPVDFKNNVFVKRDGLKRTTAEMSNSYKRTILRGDEVLICVRGTTGIMGIATPELKGCNVTRGIVPLFFNQDVDKWYMYNYLKSSMAQDIIAENTYGATLKQINISVLRSIPILVPPIELQQQFAEKAKFIEEQKLLIQQSIREFENLLAQRIEFHFA